MIIVRGKGRTPNDLFFLGEAPGSVEARTGYPFSGPTGDEIRMYDRYGMGLPFSARRDNVIREYTEGNPNPTEVQINRWTPVIKDEICNCRPKVIVAVGAFATRWLLGEKASIENVHGMPHEGGWFDSSIADRACGAIVLPMFHPAAGLHESWYRPFISWDFAQLAKLQNPSDPTIRWAKRDTDSELYYDATGADIRHVLADNPGDTKCSMGLDTEGLSSSIWSIQISLQPGTGYTLRCSQPDFEEGIDAIRDYIKHTNPCLVIQNADWDIKICRAMGLEIARARIFDPMYAAYLLGYELKGLTPLAYRFCGLGVDHFPDIIGDVGKEKQLDYLHDVAKYTWTKPDSRQVRTNNGIHTTYKPQGIDKKVTRILKDYENSINDVTMLNDPKWCEGNKKRAKAAGRPIDFLARWAKAPGSEIYKQDVSDELRQEVEDLLGSMPEPTLEDVPLDGRMGSIRYASRDAHACLVLETPMRAELERQGLTDLMDRSMRHIPCPEQIGAVGMPASRPFFESAIAETIQQADEIQDQIIMTYNDEQPFNPKSHIHVRDMLERRGLKALKKTPSGAPSTSAPSIEYLKYTDPAIALVFKHRHKRHEVSSFYRPLLAQIPKGKPWAFIHPRVKTTATTSRRYAEEGPNLMNTSRAARKGFICPDGLSFVSGDYKQIEPRIVAHLSRDTELIAIFVEGRDPYTEFAVKVFGATIDFEPRVALWRLGHNEAEADVIVDELNTTTLRILQQEYTTSILDERRQAAKVIFLAHVMYGMGGESLKGKMWEEGLDHWTTEMCDRFSSSLVQGYLGLADFKARTIKECRQQGYVRDDGGMYRYLPHACSNNNKERSQAGREAVSHKVQTYAQKLLQDGMTALDLELEQIRQNEGIYVWMCRQMHDEAMLIHDQDQAGAERLGEIISRNLTQNCGATLRVPIEVDINYADSWDKLK